MTDFNALYNQVQTSSANQSTVWQWVNRSMDGLHDQERRRPLRVSDFFWLLTIVVIGRRGR